MRQGSGIGLMRLASLDVTDVLRRKCDESAIVSSRNRFAFTVADSIRCPSRAAHVSPSRRLHAAAHIRLMCRRPICPGFTSFPDFGQNCMKLGRCCPECDHFRQQPIKAEFAKFGQNRPQLRNTGLCLTGFDWAFARCKRHLAHVGQHLPALTSLGQCRTQSRPNLATYG